MYPSNLKDIQIDISKAALKQIRLIMDHDYTLTNYFFRLKIGGKGCDGFTYETDFSLKQEDDIELVYDEDISVIIDPFTFYYAKEGFLDFLLNPQNNEDGFMFINKNEDKYHGKFFKDESMTPQIAKQVGQIDS